MVLSDAVSGWAGKALGHPEFAVKVPTKVGEQIMPTTLLLVHLDLKT